MDRRLAFSFMPRWLLLAAACLFTSGLCAADGAVQVEAELEGRETWLGERVLYQITIHNFSNPPAPDLTLLEKDFSVEKRGDRSLDSSQVMIINGRRTESHIKGHVFQYTLIPKRTGTLAIPAPVIRDGNQIYQGRALEITVRPPDQTDAAMLEIEVAPRRVLPSMPFKVTARVWIKPLPGSERDPLRLLRASALSIPWIPKEPEGLEVRTDLREVLSPMLSRDGRGFAVRNLEATSNNPFSMFDEKRDAVLTPPKRRARRADASGKEWDYWVYEITFEYTAPKPGKYEFGPLTLRGPFVTGFDGRAYQTRELYVAAPAVAVEVADLLAAVNAPADFTGAIGAVSLRASAQPSALRVGDPLTLQLDVASEPGGGGLQLIGPPDLKKVPGLEDGFAVLDEKPVGEIVGGMKRFKYALRPKKPGVSIPSLTISYYDTARDSFAQAASQPVALEVSAATAAGQAEIFAPMRNGAEAAATDLKRATGGIYRNLADPGPLSGRQDDTLWFAALPAGLGVGYVLLAVFAARRRRMAGDPALRRRSHALAEARKRLAVAELSGGTGAVQLRTALLNLVADLCHLPEAGLMPRDAAAALAAAGSSEAARTELLAILDALEAAAYGAAGGNELAGLRERAGKLAVRLDAEVRG